VKYAASREPLKVDVANAEYDQVDLVGIVAKVYGNLAQLRQASDEFQKQLEETRGGVDVYLDSHVFHNVERRSFLRHFASRVFIIVYKLSPRFTGLGCVE
jgi:truncated hemoglobin YjbI